MPISEECKEIVKELREMRELEQKQPRMAFFLYNLEMFSIRIRPLIDNILNKYFPEKKKVIRTIHRTSLVGYKKW